jgi:hypothetical protein
MKSIITGFSSTETDQPNQIHSGNTLPWGGKQILLAAIISTAAAISLSGCAWFQDRHADQEQADTHMNDFDHDHVATDHNGDRHDDQ